MQNAAPPLGGRALACEARAKPCGDNGHFESIRVDIAAKPERQGGRRDARISAITIGVRHRRDLGDIEGLAANIAEVGLLHPVVITPGNVLIAGERRLAACAFLLWREVPVTVVDLDKVVKGEFAENSERKDLTPRKRSPSSGRSSRSSAPRPIPNWPPGRRVAAQPAFPPTSVYVRKVTA